MVGSSSVYDAWTTESTNFNPAYPEMFPSAKYQPTAGLPKEISQRDWSPDYLDVE